MTWKQFKSPLTGERIRKMWCMYTYIERYIHTTTAKSLQSCQTLCDPIDGSPPGSPVPRILQARTLEWVAISFSSAWKWKVKVKSLSRVRLLVTPWTAAYQAPPSTGFSRQEYWSGVPFSIHTYYSAIKEWNNVICCYMDGPRDYHAKWSKSEKERQISYDITYM